MKLQNKLVLLSSLFATFGLMGCATVRDSDSFDLNCQSTNKTFDAENRLCVDHNSQLCPITQAMCESANKTLDANKCECVEKANDLPCQANQHVFGNSCENDSLEHCGSHDNNCAVTQTGLAYCGTNKVQIGNVNHCNGCNDKCSNGLICKDNQCVAGQGEMICSGVVVDSRSDSAHCGSCGYVCNAEFECVNSSCQRITSLTSSTTITCNAKTVKPYTDRDNCAGCNIACSNTTSCHAGVCDDAWVVGDIITFGHYEQDNDTTNGKEPITWRVLDIKDGKMLVISEKALDVIPYNTTAISITWAKSTIRSWLNGYGSSYNTEGTDFTSDNFIDTAFTSTEKAKIVSSNVPAHANPSYSTSPGSATTDKIFLLSITEAQNYFASNADRKADATKYAVKKGAYVLGSKSGKYTSNGTCTDVHCTSFWWLRSPGDDTSAAAHVDLGGSFFDFGGYVDHADVAVRPALWVNI